MSKHAAPIMALTGHCRTCGTPVEWGWSHDLDRPLWYTADNTILCLTGGNHQVNHQDIDELTAYPPQETP